ncbi:MAG: hypothetical protein ACRDLM_10825 [Gaiellaceae bacterium]
MELFAGEPELLAIADAVAATTPKRTEGNLTRTRHRRFARPTVLSVAIAVAAAVTVALIAPWHRSQGTLSDLALAALGSQPVVHVVTQTPTGAGLVDIATGNTTPVMQRDEIWYDATLGLRRDLTHDGSTVLDDVLETPQGGYTTHGIVYDCAWIAAHPVAATKARVSCNASGVNGTTPHVVPRPKPTLDPGLAGFADSYRDALASGQAQQDGTGTINGQPVDWLAFDTSDGGTERVALDRTSHKPVLLEGPHLSVRIDSIETIPYDPADFARPTPAETQVPPSVTKAFDGPSVELNASAIAVAYPNALWAGNTVAGLPLVYVEQQTLTARFADNTPTQTGAGLELSYGTLGNDGHIDRTKPYVEIQEAPSSTLATMGGFIRGGFPAAGTLYAEPLSGAWSSGPVLGIGATTINDVYVIIQTNGTGPTTLLTVARALTQP